MHNQYFAYDLLAKLLILNTTSEGSRGGATGDIAVAVTMAKTLHGTHLWLRSRDCLIAARAREDVR